MKRIFLTLLITLFCINSVKAGEVSVAIPVAYDTQKSQWSALLGLHTDNEWGPFQSVMKKGERANIAAQRALSAGTNKVYTITITGVPWEKTDNTFYHFVPVKYIPGRDLYNKARTQNVTDFVWIPVPDLFQKGKVTRQSRKQDYMVKKDFVETFQALWPKKVKDLPTKQKIAPTSKSSGQGAWTSYDPQATSWQNIPGAIYFYSNNKPYYEFTNFYEQDINIDGKVWPTTEQYYQAMKFTDGNLQETIRSFKTDASGSGPRKAFQFAKLHATDARPDWQKISLDTMRKAVRAKFTNNIDLRKLLLKTGNAVLVEDAGANDAFYGAGGDYLGQNWLGRILMEVRDELHGQPQTQPHVKPLKIQDDSLKVAIENLTHALNLLNYELS